MSCYLWYSEEGPQRGRPIDGQCTNDRTAVYNGLRRLFFNPLMGIATYNATSNNMKLVHWPLMGWRGLLHLLQRGGDWAGPQRAQAPPRCTKCNSQPINGQCKNHRKEYCCIMVRCCAVLVSQMATTDITTNRYFMKLCSISNTEIVCQEFFGLEIPSTLLSKRIAKFESLYCNTWLRTALIVNNVTLVLHRKLV